MTQGVSPEPSWELLWGRAGWSCGPLELGLSGGRWVQGYGVGWVLTPGWDRWSPAPSPDSAGWTPSSNQLGVPDWVR